MRPNRTIQEQIDEYTNDLYRLDQWQLIGWIVLIVLLIGLNFAIIGAILEYIIISA